MALVKRYAFLRNLRRAPDLIRVREAGTWGDYKNGPLRKTLNAAVLRRFEQAVARFTFEVPGVPKKYEVYGYVKRGQDRRKIRPSEWWLQVSFRQKEKAKQSGKGVKGSSKVVGMKFNGFFEADLFAIFWILYHYGDAWLGFRAPGGAEIPAKTPKVMKKFYGKLPKVDSLPDIMRYWDNAGNEVNYPSAAEMEDDHLRFVYEWAKFSEGKKKKRGEASTKEVMSEQILNWLYEVAPNRPRFYFFNDDTWE